jgi:replicative DNA helicase
MDLNIEKYLIWRMLTNPAEINAVIEIISRNDFQNTLYRHSFDTILRMKQGSKDIDLPSLYFEMGRPKNISAIITETDETLFPASHYATLLKQRNLEDDITDSVEKREYDQVQERILELRRLGKPVNIETISKIIEKIDEKKEVFKTGYRDLDAIVSFEVTDLMVLAGKSSTGKSLFGASILAYMAQSIPVGLVSFEMSEIKIVQRLSYSLSMNKLSNIDKNFFILSPVAFNLAQIRKGLNTLKIKNGVKVVLVDYLQLMSETKEFRSRHLEISHIIRQLKEVAKEFQVGMIVISSLSRNIDQKGEKAQPVLGDLKESGDIEYCSDVVCFLHREPKEMNAELIVAKNRNGMLGKIKLIWLKDRICYGNWDWKED